MGLAPTALPTARPAREYTLQVEGADAQTPGQLLELRLVLAMRSLYPRPVGDEEKGRIASGNSSYQDPLGAFPWANRSIRSSFSAGF